jgi:methyl halide transferase
MAMDALTADRWERRYQTDDSPWDLGDPAPPLVNFLADSAIVPGRMAVLGCGSGHDALLFARSGFSVTGFDFAPSAIERANAAAAAQGFKATFVEQDIFAFPPELHQTFDYVLEHTCFCAIAPTQRSAYVEVVKNLLRPGGELIGLFFTHNRPGGPPFGSRPEEILAMLKADFTVKSFQPAVDSIANRKGEEYLGVFQRQATV